MANSGFKVMDSDLHIIEPGDLWDRYMDSEYRGRVRTHQPEEWIGDLRVIIDDKSMPNNLDFTHIKPTHNQRFRYYKDKGWGPDAQIEAMDQEGIDAAVLFPSRGLFAQAIQGMDPGLGAAIARAYNNWLYDFCSHNPQRLLGAAMISPFDVENAITEARRCVKELGFKGIFLRPNPVNERNWHDPYYEPLWAELEDLPAPIGFHEGHGTFLPQIGQRFGKNFMLNHAACHPMEQMMAAISFCGGGILERHPKLRVAFLEGNCGWVPFLLWRLDEHYEWVGATYAPELTMAPSEYFKRQCFASVDCDEEPVKAVIELTNDDNIVFSTDFPHSDSKFPHAVKRFLEMPISDESKRKILWDNCARFYGLS